MRRPLRKPHGLRNEDIENYETEADYIVYTRGANIIALNGNTGKEDIQSTDFSTVLQYCVDQIPDNPMVIYIKPPGTGVYTVETTITIPNTAAGLSIIGAGMKWNDEGVVLRAGNAGVTTIIADVAVGQKFSVFRGLSFDGQEVAESWGVTGLEAYGMDSVVEYCSFYDCAIGVETRSNCWVTHNWIEVCTDGLKIGGNNSYTINNMFWQNTNDILIFVDSDRHIISCNKSSESAKFIRYSSNADVMKHVTISNNVVVGCTLSTIIVNGTSTVKYWNICGNVIDGGGTSDYFVEVTGGCTVEDWLITSNILDDFETGYFNSVVGMTIHGNTGYISENEGVTGAVADGGTFAHGLAATPTGCVVTGTVAEEHIHVSALGAANVTVGIKADGGGAGTAQVLYWRAWV